MCALAALDAAAAEDTLGGVANDGRSNFVDGGRCLNTLESAFTCAGSLCNVEEFAVFVFITLLAILSVV